jgi:phage baseplate assembly protein W
MIGMNGTSGAPLGSIDHIKQSIRDIITTPKGTRVMNREYGSNIFGLVDAPSNEATMLEIIAETQGAIARWEPRVKINKVQAFRTGDGRISLDLYMEILDDGSSIKMEGIRV